MVAKASNWTKLLEFHYMYDLWLAITNLSSTLHSLLKIAKTSSVPKENNRLLRQYFEPYC